MTFSTTVSGEVSLSSAVVLDRAVTSGGMANIAKLSFLLVDVSLADQKAFHFTGHSWRHFLPCIAELLCWAPPVRDELGRWATGAANAKRCKCGPRYTIKANRALQIYLRALAVRACSFLVSLSGDIPDSPQPAFEALAELEELRSSEYFGHSAVGYVPGFGRP